MDVPPGPLAIRTGGDVPLGPMSWAESLRVALTARPDLELGIAARAAAPCQPFDEDGVSYFAIPRPQPANRWEAARSRWLHPPLVTHDLAPALAVLRSFDPDVVHVHGTEGPFGLLAGATTVPSVISLQGLLVTSTRFWLKGIAPDEYRRIVFSRELLAGTGLLHQHIDLRRRAERELRILRSASNFIGRTQWDRRVLRGANASARYWHCDEVLRAPFYAAEWSRPPGTPFVVYSTGSTMPLKGVEWLIEAVGVLAASGMDDIRLRIAGVPSGSALEGMYRRAAARHGVGDKLALVGRVDAARLIAELRDCDVYVHPSWIDNSPNSLAEAMLVGVPCVASSVGGIPSLIRDGIDGLLTTAGDPYALAGILRDLREDPATAASFGREARATALVRHDAVRVAERMNDIYSAVVAERGHPSVRAVTEASWDDRSARPTA